MANETKTSCLLLFDFVDLFDSIWAKDITSKAIDSVCRVNYDSRLSYDLRNLFKKTGIIDILRKNTFGATTTVALHFC